jgi:hypothetical protein
MPKPPTKSFSAIVDRCRSFINDGVAANIKQYTAVIGQSDPSSQFEHEIGEALLVAVCLSLAPSPEPFSKLREQMENAAEKAASAAKALLTLQLALERMEPAHRSHLLHTAPIEIPARAALALETLSYSARSHAKGLSINSGRPSKMMAFERLIVHLAQAFEHATGQIAGVTWNDVKRRFEGKFVALVEAVLPLALSYCKVCGSEMVCPESKSARGKFVSRITQALRSRRRDTQNR